ncbi:MAG TPA: AAA family ATPase [Gaiellaceae bacterium]|nr:AAA family ATPase [Gaiellaceae bacterium]
MHLKTIKLRGFKSFVDPVEIRLEPGVAVVVGPNGSGKSNISDAILWATGSLSPHELRAEKPDDVLFAGSAGRKPVDFCEVELIFDNEDDTWPELPFSEVSLSRRLHRGGEGQYLVNRAAVRRLDLIELLSDVGLGGGLRSIISQGSVETVLGAKPGERRSLVEEAAGLGRFKLRRHRAELKLNRVSLQVERARDVEAEVRKRLRPLALQATAAERAEKLRAEIAGLEAAIATLDLARLDERRSSATTRRAEQLAARTELNAKTEQLVAARSQAEEELTDAAGAREATTASLYRLRSDVERVAHRREAAASLAARFGADLAAAEAFDPDHADGLLEAAREAGAAAQAAVADRTTAHLAAEERWARLAGAEWARHAALSAELEELAVSRTEIQRDLLGGGRDSLLALRDVAQRIAHSLESLAPRRAQLSADLEEANRGGPSPAALGRAADEADAAARAAARERDDLQARAELSSQRLATLDQSLSEREGLPPAARALVEDGERLALSAIEVPPGDERAVAAALGRLASAVVAEDPARGLELIDRAREGGLGSLVVLVDRDPARIVEALPVVAAANLLGSPVAAVTREGIGWDPVRGELWFAGETAEAVLLELEARRRVYIAELEQLDRVVEEAVAAADSAAERAAAAAAALAPVAHLRARPECDPAVLARIASGAERLDETLRVAASIAARFEEPLSARVELAARSIGEVAARELELRRAMSELDSAARAAERAAGGRVLEDSGDPGELRTEAERLSAVAAEAAASASVASERASAASRALAEARSIDSRQVSKLALERLAALGVRLEEALSVDAERFESALRGRVDADAARTAELGGTLRRLGAEEVELRAAAAAAVERLSGTEVELARIEAEREDAARRFEAADAEPCEGADRPELATRLERTRNRLAQIGQVNPLAKEEYEAEKERLDELTVQREDLEQSLAELDKLRRELTETVESRFAETFAAVEKNFSEVVASLFPGGEGRLRLTEPGEEGEEPGIEVELRPAGKRVTRLSLLSGGEKALGALAFLFSLFLSRPSPFYLLDEVEAALDDTNIGRFTALLRQYADRAQFIVVTHQKRTMEAADVLYGVTMATEGVSQIVSRRLPHEQPVAATA